MNRNDFQDAAGTHPGRQDGSLRVMSRPGNAEAVIPAGASLRLAVRAVDACGVAGGGSCSGAREISPRRAACASFSAVGRGRCRPRHGLWHFERTVKRNCGRAESRKADSDQSPLTLRDVINFAAESRDAVKEIKDYTAVFSKTEMVKGKLIKQEMQMKFRAKPFSVYFLYRGGNSDGRQAIYVDGRYDNKLIVKEANGIGSVIPGGVHLRLNDPRVVAENRYPVTHVGIANLLETTIRDWEKESKIPGDEVDVQFFPNAKLKDLPCRAIQVVHLKKLGGLQYHMNRVYFDKETKLPVRAERYGWPERPGDKPPLLEEYRYTNLQTNVNLTDADFDPARYRF